MEMLLFIAPLLLNVFGNTVYNVSGKSTPQKINSFATLSLSYFVGLVLCVILFFVTNPGGNILAAVASANWASYALGLTIVFIDLSLIMLYRAGWDVSIGSLIANIGVSLVSVAIGVACFGEAMTIFKAAGIVVCLLGLYVVNAPGKKSAEEIAAAAESKVNKAGKKLVLIKWIPVILMIVANTAYSVTAKVTPADVDTFASVSLTYLVCIVYSLIMFFITSPNKNYIKEVKKANWTAPVLGACLVCLEVSTILMFRVGWELSVGLLLAYVLLAVVLVVLGRVVYKEKLTAKRVIGIAISLLGVVL
ncbi:MAG: EamA family transporter, partial [Oscillospiraceae bacterium]